MIQEAMQKHPVLWDLIPFLMPTAKDMETSCNCWIPWLPGQRDIYLEMCLLAGRRMSIKADAVQTLCPNLINNAAFRTGLDGVYRPAVSLEVRDSEDPVSGEDLNIPKVFWTSETWK